MSHGTDSVKSIFFALDLPGSLIQTINRTEAAMRQAIPAILWLFFEPDMGD